MVDGAKIFVTQTKDYPSPLLLQNSSTSWLLAVVLFFIMLAVAFPLVFCSLVPFCSDKYKDVRHTCPNCKHLIGLYERKLASKNTKGNGGSDGSGGDDIDGGGCDCDGDGDGGGD